jgi:hypothetical protein
MDIDGINSVPAVSQSVGKWYTARLGMRDEQLRMINKLYD